MICSTFNNTAREEYPGYFNNTIGLYYFVSYLLRVRIITTDGQSDAQIRTVENVGH